MGLSNEQIDSLKKSFKTQLVSTMGARVAARPRVIVIKVRVIAAASEH